MGGAVRVERRGDVAWCTLDRPPLNLLDPELIGAIDAAFGALSVDATLRAAVLTGSGRAFTGGMNVHILHDLDVPGAKALITSIHAAIARVHHAPFPVIAAVNGFCLGAGFELALACDIRVAADAARFGLPEVRVGVPSVIEAALLPALVGPGRAAEMLLTGESIGAEQALAWGLVNGVVPAARLDAAVQTMVDKVLACGPAAIRLQKELMLRWRYTDLATAIEYGINAFATAYQPVVKVGERSVAQSGASSYTEKHGDGQTHERTSPDLDSDHRPAHLAGPSVLHTAERHPRRRRV